MLNPLICTIRAALPDKCSVNVAGDKKAHVTYLGQTRITSSIW